MEWLQRSEIAYQVLNGKNGMHLHSEEDLKKIKSNSSHYVLEEVQKILNRFYLKAIINGYGTLTKFTYVLFY
jgi:hypothetical protein